MNRVLAASLLALLSTAGEGTGCFGPTREVVTCPEVTCKLGCENGFATDANGCEICECAAKTGPTVCLESSECGTGLVCDLTHFCELPPGCREGMTCPPVCYGRCVKAEEKPVSCLDDASCATGERCDTLNYCEAGPCEGGNCDAMCWGRCVAGNVVPDERLCLGTGGKWDPMACGHARCGQPTACDAIIPGCNCGASATFVTGQGCVPDRGCADTCAGAWRDDRGLCRGPADGVLPDSCCKPDVKTCGDGGPVYCDGIPDCPAPFVMGPWNGCLACFDPADCSRMCRVDSECDAGYVCSQRASAPCDPASGDVNCARPAPAPYGVCLPVAPPPVECKTDLECPAGEACLPDPTDPCNDPATLCQRVGRHYCGPVVDPACSCPEIWAPVCGSDGRTYSNECEARCANVRAVSAGECGPSCDVACTRYDPVCGADGVTYACGEAEARCHGTPVAYTGECREACMCTTEYAPVCGADGRTYGNACEARCAGASVVSTGECRTPGGCGSDAQCSFGEKCWLDQRTGVALGKCVPQEYCAVDTDCSGLPSVCEGRWTCRANTCTISCGP